MEETKRKKFGIFKVLDLYILREFMIPFSILLISFVVLFMLGDMFERLNVFTNSKTASLWDTICYFGYKIPGNIRFILPISLLLACMYSMANLGKNSEITAMRSSGISLIRCGLSIYVVSFVITLATFGVNEGFVPEFERKAEAIRNYAEDGQLNAGYGWLIYRSTDQRRTWFFDAFDEVNPVQNSPLIIKCDNGEGQLRWEIRADSARYVEGRGWELYSCERVPFIAATNLPGRKETIDSLFLNAIEVPERHQDIVLSIKPDAELPMLALKRRLDQTPKESVRLIAKYETILYFRFAFPFSCLIGVLLGIPLAGRSMRNGIMLPIAIAAAIVVIYLMSAQIFQVLGQSLIIPSYVAGLFPTIFFLGYAIWHVIKSD